MPEPASLCGLAVQRAEKHPARGGLGESARERYRGKADGKTMLGGRHGDIMNGMERGTQVSRTRPSMSGARPASLPKSSGAYCLRPPWKVQERQVALAIPILAMANLVQSKGLIPCF